MLSIMMFAASGYKHDKHATYRTYVTQLTNALNRLLFIVALCEQELSFIDTQFVEFPQFEATVRSDCSKRLFDATVRSDCSKQMFEATARSVEALTPDQPIVGGVRVDRLL